MTAISKGGLVVISGPSGAGKTSICNALLEQIPNARWSISITTRSPRGSEQDGVEYYFVSRDEAMRMAGADELLEHAEYLGNIYGTPRIPVEQAIASGEVVIMEIDVQGAAQIAARMPDSARIFILPPDNDELESRLEGRKTETQAQMEKRLGEAAREIDFARKSGTYQHFVTNDILSDAVDRVIRIIQEALKSQ